jgi:tetratricopeptide (TPR) repeat protein
MTKAIRGLSLGISIVLALGTVHAQPAKPSPASAPTPKQPEELPDPPKKDIPPTPQPGEKADTNETLQKGGDNRPWAAGVTRDQQQQALLKFREGNAQLNDGLFARASETYKTALTSWKHPAIYYNLALALMNLDQPIDAYEGLQKAIVYGVGPLEADKFEHAKEYMLLLEKQIANIEVSCDKVGAKVSVDGKEVFVAPGVFRARVRIGRHTFVADKTGYQTRINAPFIGPGESFRIELKLYTAEELTRYNRKWQATWMPYAVIGAGVVVGIAGVALELSADATFNDYDKKIAACNMNNMGCQSTAELTDLRKSGDTKKTLGFVGYGIAGGAVAAGILLAVLNRPQAYQIRPEDLQEEPTVSIKPILSPSMAGAVVQGHF